MSKLAFYRKYRSQNFEEVVGQEHIIQTLKNAITNDRLAHAYIFSGPRGTGKTTMARILAKAVNVNEAEGQFDTLDNELCQRISNFTCADVVEIDAASNTGVDNIRDLNDRVNFTPIECAYKFYIIDEAHMLSTGAFNALLKTLEEPPAHTVFILATTEAHKIPVTIHSRCQHLRFRNLNDKEITAHLKHICENENINISDAGLSMVSRNSSGCMRDALSLLDQLYSFMGNTIEDQHIMDILGSCDVEALSSYMLAVLSSDVNALLSQHHKLMSSGLNPLQFLKELMSFSEAMMAYLADCRDLVTYPLEPVQKAVAKTDLLRCSELLAVLAKVESELRWFSNPALLLQVRLVQFVQGPSVQTQQVELLNKVATSAPQQAASPVQVQQRPASVLAAAPTPPAPQAVTPPPTPAPSTPKGPNPFANDAFSKPASSPAAPTAQATVAAAPVATQPPASAMPEGGELTINVLRSKWSAFLKDLEAKHHAVFTLIRESSPSSFDGSKVAIHLSQYIQFFVEKLKESSYEERLTSSLSAFFGQAIKFDIVEPNHVQSAAPAASPVASNNVEAAPAQSQDAIGPANDVKDETINRIVSIFEGSLVGDSAPQ